LSERSEYLKARARQDGKRAKESVNYSKGSPAAHCGVCKHFTPPNACEKVEGHIVPSYWCRLFEKSRLISGALTRRR